MAADAVDPEPVMLVLATSARNLIWPDDRALPLSDAFLAVFRKAIDKAKAHNGGVDDKAQVELARQYALDELKRAWTRTRK